MTVITSLALGMAANMAGKVLSSNTTTTESNKNAEQTIFDKTNDTSAVDNAKNSETSADMAGVGSLVQGVADAAGAIPVVGPVLRGVLSAVGAILPL